MNDPAIADTTRIKLYGDIAWSLLGSDLNRALDFARKELDLAIKSQRKADVAQAFSDIGNIYNRKAVYDSALINYYKAVVLRQQLNHELKVAGIYANIATVYMRRSDFKKALDISFRSLAIFEKYHDPGSLRTQGLIMGNIGNLYYELEMNEAAEKFYRKGLSIAQKNNDNNSGINLLVNIGGIKFEYKDADSALYYFREAEKLSSGGDQQYTLAAIYNDIGKVYFFKKDYDKAYNYYRKGLKVREELEDTYGIGLSLANIGEVYSVQKKHKEAIECLEKAEAIMTELKNYVNLHAIYAKLASAYAIRGEFKTTVDYMEKYAAVKDSIYNKGNSEKMAEMQVKYEAEKKENENLRLQKENAEKDLQLSQRRNIIIITSALFLVLLLSSFFIYWRNKLKQKQRFDAEMLWEQEMRNKAIIEAEEKERIRIARDLHDGVGQLLSAAKLIITSMFKWLTRPYPFPSVTAKTFLVNGLISAFVAFFLIVFQPFGLSESQLPNKNFFLAGYGLACFAGLSVTTLLLSIFHKNRTLEDKWNIAREITWMLIVVLVIAIFNFLYSIYVGYAIFDFHSLFLFMSYTFAIAIFPVVTVVMLNWQKHQIKNEREGREINELLHEKKADDSAAVTSDTITLKAESGSEQIEIRPGNLLYIESMDNYSAIHFLRGETVQKTLLRGSLKFMEGQLETQSTILRCHRTYIVNLGNVESASGNAQGYRLQLKNVLHPVPVSRNYLSKVLTEFKQIRQQN